jgi:hypothetical protein
MKTNKMFLFVTVVLLAAYVLSACGGMLAASPSEQAAVKVDASLVAYTGTIEGMNGDQWIVNGQALTVGSDVIRDGPFQVGDTVKVEGTVNPDGSFTVSRVEAPSASDLTELSSLGDDNANSNDDNSNDANANSNDDNSNDDNANSNDDNSNDDNANLNSNDDNSNDDNGNSNDDNSKDDDNDKDDNGSGGGGNNDDSDDDDGDDDGD